jgi:hypothetical protein
MTKFYVRNCPAYDDWLSECKCESLPHINCFDNLSMYCPIKQVLEYCFENRNIETQKIRQMFDFVEVEQ